MHLSSQANAACFGDGSLLVAGGWGKVNGKYQGTAACDVVAGADEEHGAPPVRSFALKSDAYDVGTATVIGWGFPNLGPLPRVVAKNTQPNKLGKPKITLPQCRTQARMRSNLRGRAPHTPTHILDQPMKIPIESYWERHECGIVLGHRTTLLDQQLVRRGQFTTTA